MPSAVGWAELCEAHHIPSRGNVSSRADANGNATHYAYDVLGRLIKETDGLSNVSNVITYTYDTRGNVVSRTDANGDVTNYAYDAKGHIITAKERQHRVCDYLRRKG